MDDSLIAPRMAWALFRAGRAQLIDLRARGGQSAVPGRSGDPARRAAQRVRDAGPRAAGSTRVRPGRKATEAIEVLRSEGITARAVERGMRAWLDAGLPIESSAAQGSPSSR